MYKALHQKQSQSELKIKKSAVLGAALLSTSVIVNAIPNVVSADNSKAVVSSTNPTTVNSATVPTQAAAKTQDDINKEALLVIHGDLGNGDERVQKLTAAGYDAPTVQNQVNAFYAEWGWSGAHKVADNMIQSNQIVATSVPTTEQSNASITPSAPVLTDNTVAAAQAEAQAAAAQAAAAQAAAAQAAQEAANLASTDVVSYAANQMAANTGVSASQWVHVIMAESSGNSAAVNSSSGAYGLFQLLGHGEYQGMGVDAQIAMATHVYETEGAGAWAETW